MYLKMLENYINNNLTKQDIIKFSKKENVSLTEIELNIIYNYIKKDWLIIVKNDPTPIFNDLKTKLQPNTYNKIIELYNKYKSYKKYL